MLWFIIDGWNLSYKLRLNKESFPCLSLINFIKNRRLTGSLRNKVTIVFDGKMKDLFREEEYEIIFSYDKSADEIIKSMVENALNKKIIIVVSDDREIKDFAKRNRVKSISTEEFLAKDRTKKKNVEVDGKEKDIDYRLKNKITDELRKIWLDE